MTIKEIENLSGMTRANIRFYETEGLLTPSRDSNGYRNYTEKDLEILKRIRLLRTLHLSLADIRAADSGERRLDEVLAGHLHALKEEEAGLIQCQDVCEQMCRDHVVYDTFDAQRYLDLLNSPGHNDPPELKEDTVPKVTSPWIRFFAREIVWTLWSLVLNALLALVLGISIDTSLPMGARTFPSALFWSGIGSILASNIFVLIFEPVFLSLTGTTPGKFVFGLSVTSVDGKRLTYREALRRTWDVLRKGYGFFIPILTLIDLYLSYRSCKAEKTLYWEEDSTLHLKSERLPLGVLACIFTLALSLGLNCLMDQTAALPPNRGELTVAEFCENYNDTQDFYSVDRQLNLPPSVSSGISGIPDSALYLDPTGNWEKKPGTPYIVSSGEYAPLPDFHFTVSDKVVTGVEFSYRVENENVKISSFGELMSLAAVSYICAQEDYSLFPDTPDRIHTRITEAADLFENFSFSEAGVSVTCQISHEGYDLEFGSFDSAVLEPVYGENACFSIEFSMQIAH